MLISFGRSFLTDYVPAAKPPWLLFAMAFSLLLMGLPREFLPAAFASTGLLVAGGSILEKLSDDDR